MKMKYKKRERDILLILIEVGEIKPYSSILDKSHLVVLFLKKCVNVICHCIPFLCFCSDHFHKYFYTYIRDIQNHTRYYSI